MVATTSAVQSHPALLIRSRPECSINITYMYVCMHVYCIWTIFASLKAGCWWNLVHRFLNKFATECVNVSRLIWIMSLHYPVKLEMLIAHVLLKPSQSQSQWLLYSASYRDETWPAALFYHRKWQLIGKSQWCCSANAAIHWTR